MVVGLAVVGVAFALLGVWVLRQTRADLEVLAPLERMGDGDWKKRDPSTQRRMLDEVRPDGAQPLVSERFPPPLDDEFEQVDHPVSSFSDLGPGLGVEQRDPTPLGLDPDLDLGLVLPATDGPSAGDPTADADDIAGDDVIATDDQIDSDDEIDSDEPLSDLPW